MKSKTKSWPVLFCSYITETTTFHCLQINTEYFQLSLQEYNLPNSLIWPSRATPSYSNILMNWMGHEHQHEHKQEKDVTYKS